MKLLPIFLIATCLLACGGAAESVDRGATTTLPSEARSLGSPPPAASANIPAPPPPPPREDADPEQFKTVHLYTRMFYEGQLDLLHQRFSDDMAESFPLEQLSTLFEQVGQLYGKELSVLGEEAQTKDDYRGFVRWARFDKTDEVLEIQWILNPADEIAGFFVRPAQRKLTTSVAPLASSR